MPTFKRTLTLFTIFERYDDIIVSIHFSAAERDAIYDQLSAANIWGRGTTEVSVESIYCAIQE